jgi:hypothetical protein
LKEATRGLNRPLWQLTEIVRKALFIGRFFLRASRLLSSGAAALFSVFFSFQPFYKAAYFKIKITN